MKHCHPVSFQSTCSTHGTGKSGTGNFLVFCAEYVNHIHAENNRLVEENMKLKNILRDIGGDDE